MFGTHFYHATLRKAVSVFGTIFNDISVIRLDGSGGVLNQIKVPLSYGPKQKFLARLDANSLSDGSMALKLPRMSFEITSLEQDTTSKLNKMAIVSEGHETDSYKKKSVKHMSPYNIGMQLSIMAKNQDDGLQILEQILPYFQPEYTVTIKPINGWQYKQDVPIVLTGTSIADDYEGDFTSRRVLTYTLDFTMKMRFFGPTRDSKVIKEINIDYFNQDNTAEKYYGVNLAVNPTTADSEDTLITSGTPGANEYKITTGYDPIGVPESFAIYGTVLSGTFISGETITSSQSNNTMEVSNTAYTTNPTAGTITVSQPSGWLNIGEVLTGGTSGATITVASYS
jgi:hypothetical protein